MRSSIQLLVGLWLFGVPAQAADRAPPPDNPLVFVVNPRADMESGIRTVNSLSRVAFLYDAAWVGAVDLDEGTPLGKTAGTMGRALKGFFVDLPLVGLQSIFLHEVFGHGARGREAGLEPRFEFHLVPPYRSLLSNPEEGDSVASAFIESDGLPERDMLIRIGGIEADYASAWWLNIGMVERDGWMHYRDMLQYGVAKLTYIQTFSSDLSTVDAEPTGNDVSNYVTELQLRFNRWRPEGRAAIAKNLRVAYLFNFVDPTLWLAGFHGVSTYGYGGQRAARFPMIPAGDWQLYPATRFSLTPFGAEHAVDLFARHRGVTFDVYGRGGSSGLASYWGGGARAFGIPVLQRGTLGGELDFWRQPDVILERLFVFDRGDRLGGNVGVHLDWTVHRQLGVVGKLAYKTEGYLMAQPLDRGMSGYVGMSITPAR